MKKLIVLVVLLAAFLGFQFFNGGQMMSGMTSETEIVEFQQPNDR